MLVKTIFGDISKQALFDFERIILALADGRVTHKAPII